MHKATMTTQWFLQFTHRKHLKLKLNVKHSIDILYLPESRLDDYLALICKLILQSYMWKKRKGVLINDIDPVNVLQLNIVNPWKSMILYQNYWVWQQKHYTHYLSGGLWIHLYYHIWKHLQCSKNIQRTRIEHEYSNPGNVKWKVDFNQQCFNYRQCNANGNICALKANSDENDDLFNSHVTHITHTFIKN